MSAWFVPGERCADLHRQALEAFLKSYPPWTGGSGKPRPSIRYRPLTNGVSNATWCVAVGPKAFVVKIPGSGSGPFIDRAVAARASRRAARLGLAPAVVDVISPSGIEITAYRADWGHIEKPALALRLGQVARVLRALHKGPLWGHRATIFDLIDARLRIVREVYQTGGLRDFSALEEAYHRARRVMMRRGLSLAACWNDPMTTNFLVKGPAMCIVDLEYAGNNDRWYDLAVFLGEINARPAQERAAILAYDPLADEDTLAWVRVLRTLADYKLALWTLCQARLSTLPLDFDRYARWKYARARARLAGRAWREDLALLADNKR
ncbi:MAG: phosphotransferase [Pseudomonadota bacterium]